MSFVLPLKLSTIHLSVISLSQWMMAKIKQNLTIRELWTSLMKVEHSRQKKRRRRKYRSNISNKWVLKKIVTFFFSIDIFLNWNIICWSHLVLFNKILLEHFEWYHHWWLTLLSPFRFRSCFGPSVLLPLVQINLKKTKIRKRSSKLRKE